LMDIKKVVLALFVFASLSASGYSKRYKANLKKKGVLNISYYG
jgi:hypothetical protein